MRKLVTVRKVTNILPINNCDNIVLAVIDGWSVIVKKTEFAIGDNCLFFEIDSFIPVSDTRFEFLKKPITFDGNQGYRIKTMKMKGVISQGLALPLTMFPELTIEVNADKDYSEQLKVVKYDNAIQLDSGPYAPKQRAKGSFPSFIPKTDQNRIQNLTYMFDTFQDEEFEETLKLDGSSMTCYKTDKVPNIWSKIKALFGFKIKPYHFGVCSRNLELAPNADQVITFNNDGKLSEYRQDNFWRTAIKHQLEEKLPVGYAIQGELIGPSIQANHEKVADLDYFIFDVFNIKTQKYLLPEERRAFCKEYNLQHIPVVTENYKPFQLTLEELLTRVDTESMNPGTISEGRVYKHVTQPLSFKVINNRYLLKSEQ